MRKPVVSVVMPVRNAERYLREAVESVLAQTFRDFELLVVDDGSTDGSVEVVRSFRDERVRLLPNEGESYLAGALTHGCRQARGELIARMDADDICLPERLARQVEFIRSNPETGIVGSNVDYIDEQGDPFPVRSWLRPRSHEAIRSELLLRCPICHPTAMMQRQELENLGWYESSLLKGREEYSAEDLDLWRRATRTTKLANLQEPLLLYRIHEKSISREGGKKENHLRNVAMVARELYYDEWGERLDLATCAAVYGSDAPKPPDPASVLRLIGRIFLTGASGQLSREEYAVFRELCLSRARGLADHEDSYTAFINWTHLARSAPILGIGMAPWMLRRLIK